MVYVIFRQMYTANDKNLRDLFAVADYRYQAAAMASAMTSAVQVGAQNLVDPFACPKIIAELPKKLDEYGIAKIKDIIGRSLTL